MPNARHRKNSRKKVEKQTRQIQIMAMATMALVIIILIVFWLQASAIPEQSLARLELDPFLGNPDAPINIIEYGAYGCEACRAWHEAGIVEQILEEFPNQVKFIYRDMPIILPTWSQEMAELAQCALDQGNDAFWRVHHSLFTETVQGITSIQEMMPISQAYGLNTDELENCVELNIHYETVRYDMNRPDARGIRGTPTWFINGQQIFNASPDILRQVIRNELQRLGL